MPAATGAGSQSVLRDVAAAGLLGEQAQALIGQASRAILAAQGDVGLWRSEIKLRRRVRIRGQQAVGPYLQQGGAIFLLHPSPAKLPLPHTNLSSSRPSHSTPSPPPILALTAIVLSVPHSPWTRWMMPPKKSLPMPMSTTSRSTTSSSRIQNASIL